MDFLTQIKIHDFIILCPPSSVMHHPKLTTLTPDLAALCRALSRFPLQQSYMLLLYRYLTTYSISKLQASLFGATKFMSQGAEQGGICTYLGTCSEIIIVGFQ